MSSVSSQEVGKLSLDLKNFRTVPQKKEKNAIKAMITIKPERFYAIMKSLLEDGYIPTENIIVLKEGDVLTVKEGNRRIAAMKIIHGYYKLEDFNLPSDIIKSIKTLSDEWKQQNLKVPCTIFNKNESATADKVVALAHGKGEQASRDIWSSVARARHNRDAKEIAEPALDLLESYLKVSTNISDEQKERWAGDYPITVLHEAIRFLFSRLGFTSLVDFVNKYPKLKDASKVDELIRDIGLEGMNFKQIRDVQNDFALKYGFAPIVAETPTTSEKTGTQNSSSPTTPTENSSSSASSTSSSKANLTTAVTPLPPAATKAPAPKKAVAISDPKHVAALLKSFNPSGNNREKVVTLRDEIKKLDISKTPIAFCFVLRSMFEISAKAYCADHRIHINKAAKNGKPPVPKTLAELLKEITTHLTTNNTDKAKSQALHGASTEISKSSGILSITSMNQLVHNSSFSVIPSDICTLFGNIYPLLKEMN